MVVQNFMKTGYEFVCVLNVELDLFELKFAHLHMFLVNETR